MQATGKNTKNILLILVWMVLIPLIAYVSATNLKLSLAVPAGIVGLALCVISILNYRLGFYIFITVTLCIRLLERMSGSEQSVGVVMDTLLLSTLLGTFFKKSDPSTARVAWLKDPLLITLYLYIAYLCIQLFNPNVYSTQGWFIFMRVFLRNMIYIYLGLKVFNNMEDVRTFFRYWLIISTLAAFYGCLQQWFGLMPYEQVFVARYPEKFKTVIILAGVRVFSFMSDPAAFGLLMAGGTIICLVLLTAAKEAIGFSKKILLVISMVLHMLALAYSGTRTGYIMVPMGLLIFFLVNLHNRNTVIAAVVFAACAVVILYGPFYGSATVQRVRTAFVGSQDESLNVRDVNRHRIQPYIYKHPIGGGLMTTGTEGTTFHPGHPLAGFPPDSGYLRAVLEMGWIGLALVCLNFFFLLKESLENYFRARHSLHRLMMICITSVVFSFVIGQYAQDAAGLVESALLLNAFTAITVKMRYS